MVASASVMLSYFGRRIFWVSAAVIGFIALALALWFIWSATHPSTAIDRSENFFEFLGGIGMGVTALLGLSVLGRRSVRENCGITSELKAWPKIGLNGKEPDSPQHVSGVLEEGSSR